MTTNDAGLRQSQAHARAARTLSDALTRQREIALAIAQAEREDKTAYVEDAKNAGAAVAAARKVLRDAFLEYTNPFNVRKTV